jgi:predicted short-subunit dehydrogenase-like oxidoreductase (DUF2520 family)
VSTFAVSEPAWGISPERANPAGGIHCDRPGIRKELERYVIKSVNVIGRGRVGSAIVARLEERGVELTADQSELVLLCVPDTAIADVVRCQTLDASQWVGHTSGATPLSALGKHERRFGLHPLQSFSRSRGPEQLDGAWAAVTAETPEARDLGHALAETLGLRPFDLADDRRVAYHAGAAMASNYVVTLRAAAGSLLKAAGAPPEALDPLIRGVLDGGFELTGPIARGDWDTVLRHLEAIRAERPELEELYVVLAEATARIAERPLPSDTVSQGVGLR